MALDNTEQNRALKIVAAELKVAAAAITPEKRLCKDLGADSIDIMMLTCALEREFGVALPEDRPCRTVGDLFRLLEEQTL